ncbi:MAG: hypothetical protein SH818_13815 [Saprospiraceae bacterium]|nr:hypothetical protein [Saprospiraceae bacterium]
MDILAKILKGIPSGYLPEATVALNCKGIIRTYRLSGMLPRNPWKNPTQDSNESHLQYHKKVIICYLVSLTIGKELNSDCPYIFKLLAARLKRTHLKELNVFIQF